MSGQVYTYEGFARIPLTINGNTYMTDKTQSDGHGNIVVYIVKSSTRGNEMIQRKSKIDEHGIAILNIDKTKVIFGVESGRMWLK